MPDPVDDIPPEDLAAARDAARDYLIMVRSARSYAAETAVDLDGYADGELAKAPTAHLRDAQSHLQEASDLLESEAAVVESLLDSLSARLAALPVAGSADDVDVEADDE